MELADSENGAKALWIQTATRWLNSAVTPLELQSKGRIKNRDGKDGKRTDGTYTKLKS